MAILEEENDELKSWRAHCVCGSGDGTRPKDSPCPPPPPVPEHSNGEGCRAPGSRDMEDCAQPSTVNSS